jgi:hypothetical protein
MSARGGAGASGAPRDSASATARDRKSLHAPPGNHVLVEFSGREPEKSTRAARAAGSASSIPPVGRKTLHARAGASPDVEFSAVRPDVQPRRARGGRRRTGTAPRAAASRLMRAAASRLTRASRPGLMRGRVDARAAPRALTAVARSR